VRFDPERHHRRSIRRKGHDYRQGVYFVTITTAARQPLFGEVRNGVVWLSAAGALVADVWMHLPTHFPNVRLDAFVVMPDHFHGILVLGEVAWWSGIAGASQAPFILTPPMRYPPFWEQMLAAEARARGVPERLLPTPAELVRARSPRPEPNTQGTDTVPLQVRARSPRPEPNTQGTDTVPLQVRARSPRPEPNTQGTDTVPLQVRARSPRPEPNTQGTDTVPLQVRARFPHPEPNTQGTDTAPLQVRARSPRPEPNTQGTDTVPLPRETRSPIQNPTLGQVIAYFKYQTTKRYNLPQAQPGATLWHTNYYERRLATCDALSTARAYILTNPARAG